MEHDGTYFCSKIQHQCKCPIRILLEALYKTNKDQDFYINYNLDESLGLS